MPESGKYSKNSIKYDKFSNLLQLANNEKITALTPLINLHIVLKFLHTYILKLIYMESQCNDLYFKLQIVTIGQVFAEIHAFQKVEKFR